MRAGSHQHRGADGIPGIGMRPRAADRRREDPVDDRQIQLRLVWPSVQGDTQGGEVSSPQLPQDQAPEEITGGVYTRTYTDHQIDVLADAIIRGIQRREAIAEAREKKRQATRNRNNRPGSQLTTGSTQRIIEPDFGRRNVLRSVTEDSQGRRSTNPSVTDSFPLHALSA
jgi:hypothetical protein